MNDTELLTYLILAPTLFANLFLLLRTIVASYKSVARLRLTPQSWDAFILTGEDARSFVLERWRAVVRASFWIFLIVVAIRTALLCYPIADFWQQTNTWSSVNGFIPTLPHTILVGVVMFIVGAMQLPFVAAIGILASLSDSKFPGREYRVFTTWLLVTTLLGAIFLVSAVVYNYFTTLPFEAWYDPTTFYDINHFDRLDVLASTGGAFIDSGLYSGMSITSMLVYGDHRKLIVAAILTGGYALTTWVILRLSIRLAARQGMLSAKEINE